MGPIKEYKLVNKNYISIIILSYGGIIKEINTPDKNGNVENIVLNHKSNHKYLTDSFYMGAVIGRYANRIAKSTFKLDENIYHLDKNEGENHLHGGLNAFHKKHWKLIEYDKEQKFVILSINSLDSELGYPGNLNCNVKYSLNDQNEFKIEFFAKSDKDTIFNPSSHSYFNLNPLEKSIFKHQLKINSDNYIPVDNECIPLGSIESVLKTPFDFTKFKMIGKEINSDHEQLKIGKGYDHCFVLNKNSAVAAELWCEASGRKLIISTDQPGIQFYSGNHLSGFFNKNQGLCLETQHFPNSPNNENLPSTIIKANNLYYSSNCYLFSNI